ncbi:MAG: biotin--[acetyl-CoA-carboxylase] ligase, partial [Ignavibacteria bacterium]|nr:biotin--[acetyl-CoA-carboxylase] ligase [Ignavibacteria bacterium]
MNKEIGKEKLIALAEYQTKGRGRFEREWLSNKFQNLTFSLGLKPDLNLKQLPKLNFTTALAVALAIEDTCNTEAEIKWPNDLLLNGKKFCGILIESSIESDSINKVVIGIGLNVNQEIFPDELRDKATSLKCEFQKSFEREILLAKILLNFENLLTKIPSNFDEIYSEWKKRCKSIGKKISLTDGSKTYDGIFHAVNEDGSIILKTQNQLLSFNTGCLLYTS